MQLSLLSIIKKGNKVKINSINFSGNENIADQKLKKQMKGTKEMNRITFFRSRLLTLTVIQLIKHHALKNILSDVGFLVHYKNKGLC